MTDPLKSFFLMFSFANYSTTLSLSLTTVSSVLLLLLSFITVVNMLLFWPNIPWKRDDKDQSGQAHVP